MGVSPHVWGEVLPWLNIFATLAIYILVWVAYKFFKYNFAPDEQDEVSLAQKDFFCKTSLVFVDSSQGETRTEEKASRTRGDCFY